MSKKTCTGCGKSQDINRFPETTKRGQRVRRAMCRDCYNAYHKARRKTRPHKAYVRKKREDLKQFVDELKSVPCTDCGRQPPPYCMDFDHLEGKEIEVSRMVGRGYSKKRVLEEISKCEVVCAVCHRIRTFGNGEKFTWV